MTGSESFPSRNKLVDRTVSADGLANDFEFQPTKALCYGPRAVCRFIAYDAKGSDSKFAPIKELRPPEGAPNVLIVLLDDVGFGASSAFGGPCQSPTA